MPSLRPTTSPTSTSSASSSHASSSSHPIPTINVHEPARPHPNLPPPPPPDRIPPPKGRSLGAASRKLRIKRDKGRDHTSSNGTIGDDEEWTLEGESVPGRLSDHNGSPLSGSQEILSPLEAEQPMFDSQLTEVPSREREKKPSKGRQLVKKTSRLFSRDRDRSAEGDSSGAATPSSSSSLHVAGTRQASYSSVTSNESASARNNRVPPPANGSRSISPPWINHARRRSQDSQSSWAAPSSVRSGASSNRDSPIENHLPIPQRQMANLSASVPTLSRRALPQPAPPEMTQARSNDNFPSRMSSWFSHLLPSSSYANENQGVNGSSSAANPPSPARKGPSAAASFLDAARRRAVDGMRNLLDSEAQPDKCPDTIWVMGVGHPGWRPSTPSGKSGDLPPETEVETERRGSGSSGKPSPPAKLDHGGLRPTAWAKKQTTAAGTTSPQKGIGGLFSSSTVSLALPVGSPSKDSDARTGAVESPGRGKREKREKEVLRWPEQFYEDFTSRVWFTYRSQYAPILSLPPDTLIPSPDSYFSAFGPPVDVTASLPAAKSLAATSLPSRASTSPWAWTSRSGEERGLTSDSGWGCMLRTGQSLLVNALIHLHLGRDWRLGPAPIFPLTSSTELDSVERYATYVRILSWFLDDPSPLCPFSVHRMALIGKELGKEVGEWFGPSTAAGALKTLANSFAPAELAVATATDSIVYRSDVYAASSFSSNGWRDAAAEKYKRRHSTGSRVPSGWGGKAVLILIGVRLGLDGVNPIYYDSIKSLFTFPQSVGIAGGRPSSSYYFVGSQASSLFYLDPHFTRPAIPLRVPPAPSSRADAFLHTPRPEAPTVRPDSLAIFDDDQEEVVVIDSEAARSSPNAKYKLDVVDVDDLSDSESDISSSPSSHLQQATVRPARPPRLTANRQAPPPQPLPQPDTPSTPTAPTSPDDPFMASMSTPTGRRASATSERSVDPSAPTVAVDSQTEWYATAYSEAQLRTFHCEKVRKIPLSGLDPSMLLGFLCKDEADFEDFSARVAQLPHKIFTVQVEPPSWGDSDDGGLESVSEPDMSEPAGSDPSMSMEAGVEPDVELDDLAEDLAGTQLVSKSGAVDIPTMPNGLSPSSRADAVLVSDGSAMSSEPVLVEKPSLPSVPRSKQEEIRPAQEHWRGQKESE